MKLLLRNNAIIRLVLRGAQGAEGYNAMVQDAPIKDSYVVHFEREVHATPQGIDELTHIPALVVNLFDHELNFTT